MLRSAEKSVFHSELGFEVKHFDNNLVKLRIFAKKRDFVVFCEYIKEMNQIEQND